MEDQFVQVFVQLGGIAKHSKGTCSNQLVLAAAATGHAGAGHPGSPGIRI